ncbi:glycerate kinase [Pseudomonas sp. TTU2014-080ASC]|uniref:glycerate kinase n=1 Tax=Pseudomonas sp. TTU2014-080ASC TaxID=1729724 RepID=UPI000718A99A|nr:glycerate kinase [Pseudomonas sp. TTU2014-080ASC]KRW61980.1 glycerate kinase [Pseudomonas sp. TTU2014-080ASC]
MKVVIAPDSFKESLGAAQVAAAIGRGWKAVFPQAEIVLRPMADGGEGTVDAVLSAIGGERRVTTVEGPLGKPVDAHWGWLPGGTALIEMAAASGLALVAPEQRDPGRTSTYGTGQLISAALDAGARHIILALGGSATNDGGTGLLRALGVRFLDAQGQTLAHGGAALSGLHRIDRSGLDPRLADVSVQVAADVDNPLCGPYGASAVFGPQKGASAAQVEQLDDALRQLAVVVATDLGKDFSQEPGVGAAGGLGFAARAFLNACFRPGVELVTELTGLAQSMAGANLVITGEGRFDAQSLHGKTPVGVAKLAQSHGIPVVVLAGSLGEGYQQMYQAGVVAAFSVVPGPMTLEQACADAEYELQARASDIARLWKIAGYQPV